MPELRKDPVIGRWVIIAAERARRPGNFVDRSEHAHEPHEGDCAFCGNGGEPADSGASSGDVRVIAYGTPVSGKETEYTRTRQGLYDVIDGFGVDETVVETTGHIANMADLDVPQIRRVFETFAARMLDLEKNTRLRYALAYKNYGPTAGSRNIGHACSHIVATPVQPLRVKEKLSGAKEYFDRNRRCVYCDLVRQEAESCQRVVHETEHFMAVIPFAARYLFETWILPRGHHCDFPRGVKGKEADLAGMMKTLLNKLRKGLDDPAYNFVIQTAPFRRSRPGMKKWETIEQDYHWHIELMPRLTRLAGFEKGTGFYICAVPPEDMAEYLRGIVI